MSDLNSVMLIGRLTRDAELKNTSAGVSICKFSLAVNRRRKDGDQWVDEASFFDVSLWGRQGESITRYLTKGKQVAVAGELRQERWEQNGQSRSRVEIVATNVQLLGSQGEGPSAQRQAPQAPQRQAQASPAGNKFPQWQPPATSADPAAFADDIPF